MTEEEARRVPLYRNAIEGPNESGKSSVALQARRCLQVSAGFATLVTKEKHFLPWIIGAEEPVGVPLEEHAYEAFGVPPGVEDLTYRELCKGYLTEPIQQLIGFLVSRNRLNRNASLVRRMILSNERSLDGWVLPGVWLTETGTPIDYGLVDRKLAPRWATREDGVVPIQMVTDRSEFSSVVYQAFQLSYYYDIPLEEALRLVWETHVGLAEKGYLYPMESLTVVLPYGQPIRYPRELVRKSLPEYRSVITREDHEVDIPEQIFEPEEELYVYLKAIDVLREHPSSPRIVQVHNDPMGEYHRISPLAVLTSSLIAESSYPQERGVTLSYILERWIDVISDRTLFSYMAEDLGFDPQPRMLEQLKNLHELQPEIERVDGRFEYVPKDLFTPAKSMDEYLNP